MDGNDKEWAVAYHGFGRGAGHLIASKIIVEGLRIGWCQTFIKNNDRCQKTG